MTDEQESIQLPEGFSERVQDAGGELIEPGIDGMHGARIPADNIVDFMKSLKEGPGTKFGLLLDVCSVDEYENRPRFDVIYHLRSIETGDLVRIKSFAQGNPPEIASMVPLFPTADWHEREAYDMMGIRFIGHPELKRILMPLEYEGYPLRKDFPREGIEPDRLYKRQFPE